MRNCALIALLLSSTVASAQPSPSFLELVRNNETDLSFDSMFPRRSPLGKSPDISGWSFDDRYVAYSWNPWDVRSLDLWLYDTVSGKSEKLSSIDKMATVDRDAKLAIDFFKKEEERLVKWETLSDIEWRTTRQKFSEEQSKRTKPDPSYPGVSNIVWAHKSHEFLMTYRGDIWRWKLGQQMPTRITQTKDVEFSFNYLPDDSGFVYRRGTGVYKKTFGNEFVRQINPDLPAGVTLDGFRISPDGKKVLITASKAGPPARQVDWISYRDRFAQARKATRGVAEDDFLGESHMYIYGITDKELDNVDSEQTPSQFYKYAGGEELEVLSLSRKPWSRDSSTILFSTFKRDKKIWKIEEFNTNVKVTRTLWEGTSDGEHTTPTFTLPFYSYDGKNVICLLDKSGWRQVHVIDRDTKVERQLTTGEFETYPLKMSADKKSILVRSSKEALSRRNLYRVNLTSGEWTPLSPSAGVYSSPSIGNKSDKMASVFSSFDSLREMVVLEEGKEKTITDSHKKEAFFSYVKQKPQFFSFKNRHGDTIQGYQYLPEGVKDTSVKRPLFIYVYGGPLGDSNSVTDGAWSSTATMFNMYLTRTLGYVTVTIDPRGQSGYDARFGKANFNNPGVPQTEDLVDCVNYFKENYTIDSTKVGLNGWSFGGWQTQHAMYTQPDVFTLGIAGAGPTEWQNYNNWYVGGVIGNTPKNDPLYLDKFSLTKIAGNLKGQLLLLHGIEDTNVLFQDTINVYRKLLQAGKGPLVELALDPTGGHGLGGDIDTRDRHAIYLSFLAKHWGTEKVK